MSFFFFFFFFRVFFFTQFSSFSSLVDAGFRSTALVCFRSVFAPSLRRFKKCMFFMFFFTFSSSFLLLPVDWDHLRAWLRTALLGLLHSRSNSTFYRLRIPETERQMGALAAVCTSTLKSVMAENTVTLLVAEHQQLSAQRSA